LQFEERQVYISEEWLISPGTNEISRANFNIRFQNDNSKFINCIKEVKLDSCGSVSLAHSKYLTNIKSCKLYKIPVVTLNGIGGKTHPITEAGVLTHVTPQKKCVKFLCYVFDTPVGNAKEILLLGLSTIVDANIDIRYHMNFSVQGISKMIKFLEEEPAQTFILHAIHPLHDVPQEDGITGKETASEL
jgi:hypothetical protein